MGSKINIWSNLYQFGPQNVSYWIPNTAMVIKIFCRILHRLPLPVADGSEAPSIANYAARKLNTTIKADDVTVSIALSISHLQVTAGTEQGRKVLSILWLQTCG